MSEQRVVLVTGAASGIGLQVAKNFLLSGAKVVAGDINEPLLETRARELGENYLPLALNVADEQQIGAASEFIEKELGRLDVLVNNAAVANLGEPEGLVGEAFDREMAVNLKGPMLLVKHLAPLLRKSGNGSVINICSVAATIEAPGHYLYAAAKVALDKFTRDCTQGVRGVRHNSILPGVIDTPILSAYGEMEGYVKEIARTKAPAGRMGQPADIANAVEFLCSDKATFINGASLIVDGGLAAATSAPF